MPDVSEPSSVLTTLPTQPSVIHESTKDITSAFPDTLFDEREVSDALIPTEK
jgi:hypothetical protein